MFASPQKSFLTPEEYLELENNSDTKHEYFAGEVFAMAGATDAHVTIALNIAILLRSHLRKSGCRVYISDMKAKIEQKNRFFYPDVMVTCAQEDQQNQLYKEFPCLVIEVLSDSTEAFDRGDKFADYQALPSLQEYVLVNTRKARIECFRRAEHDQWLLQSYTLDKPDFELTSVGLAGKIADIYQDVDFSLASDTVDES